MPDNATAADFEAIYALRGAALARCEGKRDLAVQTHLEEHRLIDEWLEAIRPRSWLRKLWPG